MLTWQASFIDAAPDRAAFGYKHIHLQHHSTSPTRQDAMLGGFLTAATALYVDINAQVCSNLKCNILMMTIFMSSATFKCDMPDL